MLSLQQLLLLHEFLVLSHHLRLLHPQVLLEHLLFMQLLLKEYSGALVGNSGCSCVAITHRNST